MSLTERERHDAYEALHAAFGDTTDNVIRMFRTEHEDLATKDDLALTRAELKTEMADLRTEMAGLRTELKTEMGELRVQFSNDITTAFAAQTRTMTIALVASVILIALTNTLTVLVS